MTGRVATAETEIDAPRSKVWRALTDPDQIQKYMFGSRVETDWKPGSRITWKGEYEGKKYEDKGKILEVVQDRRLKVTHFSPLSGEEDAPENYHTLVYELTEDDGKTACLVDPGQQLNRGGRGAVAGQLGEDALGAEEGRRGAVVAWSAVRSPPARRAGTGREAHGSSE